MYKLSKEQLFSDLQSSFIMASKHKRNKNYVKAYVSNFEENLKSLCDDLYNRKYKAEPSECFLIEDPKLREVFAASFRDRIVHHLYYRYVHKMLERTFIADSYSCIKKRGVLYGIKRLQSHILQESKNYSQPCYVLKMDLKGYFMSISRDRLLTIVDCSLGKMANHKVNCHADLLWKDIVDMDFVNWLSKEIIMLDPTIGCVIKGNKNKWKDLADSKSLFKSPEGVGLPIGNLTSQLFSNVYLNEFDQYMKRILGCRHYGRYVDDFYIVCSEKKFLHSIIPKIKAFLFTKLGLSINEGKTEICNAFFGVNFLGSCIKPWHLVPSGRIKKRICKKLREIVFCLIQEENDILKTAEEAETYEEKYNAYICLKYGIGVRLRSQINSYFGYLSHYQCSRFVDYCINNILSSTTENYGYFRKKTRYFALTNLKTNLDIK